MQNERVYLIEYGAGFFVERNSEEAIGFYTRKIKLIREKSEKLEKIIQEKREGAKQCEIRIMAYVQQQQQQQPKPQWSYSINNPMIMLNTDIYSVTQQ